jgi:proteasome lid subunit RPN8/RPN11
MAALTEWTPEPIQFSEDAPDGGSIWLSSVAIAAMIDAATKAGRCETGGILIGRYGAEGWSADIVEATPKPKGSLAGWFWFQRSKHGLARLLEERWSKGFYYLGEWHYHPGASPTPSGPDIRAMKKVARDEAYNCPSPILVILGGGPKTQWSISATLFRSGEAVNIPQKENL